MTDQPYPPFSGDDVTCPKCGGERVEAEYKRPGAAYPTEIPATIGATGPEWMLRRCAACGYTWPEMCADVDKGEPMPTGDDFIDHYHDENLASPRDRGIVQRLIGKRDWP